MRGREATLEVDILVRDHRVPTQVVAKRQVATFQLRADDTCRAAVDLSSGSHAATREAFDGLMGNGPSDGQYPSAVQPKTTT